MISLNNLKEKEALIFKKMRASIGVLNHMFNTLLDISKLDANFDYVENFFDLRHAGARCSNFIFTTGRRQGLVADI
jgi:hypothetical protein